MVPDNPKRIYCHVCGNIGEQVTYGRMWIDEGNAITIDGEELLVISCNVIKGAKNHGDELRESYEAGYWFPKDEEIKKTLHKVKSKLDF